MALAGPKFYSTTEDAPRGYVVKSTSTIFQGAMFAIYTAAAGGDQGYVDNVGASANMTIAGVALRQNGGAQATGHTLTMSAEILADEAIIPVTFSGGLDTSKRGMLVFGVDENTGSLTPGAGIPVGMLLEVISSTLGKVGVGPSFVARAASSAAATLTSANAFQVDEFTNPVAASAVNLLAATASTVAVQTYLTADLVSAGKAALLAYPRNVYFTTGGGTAADAPATAVITGTDIDGNALTETVNIAQTATTAIGVKAFKTITSIVYAAGDGTGATVSIGVGVKMGFSKSIRSRAGFLAAIQQVAAGSVVTTGTFVDATTSPPHGTYAPATAQDGANDYSVTYEHS